MPQEKRSAVGQGAGELGEDAGGNLRPGVDMHRMHRLPILLTSLAVAVLSGCASSAVVSKSSALADAGIAYGAAAQDILPLVFDSYLDWQSNNMLEEWRDLGLRCTMDEIADPEERSMDCTTLIDGFEKDQKALQAFAQSLEHLDAHARELGTYFRSLKTLAGYDSAASASNAAGRAIDRINGLSRELEGGVEISSQQREAWAGLVGLVGDSIKAGHLRERLRADAAAIARAIDIQGGVLSASITLLKALDEAARSEEYRRRVRTPYLTGSIDDENRWRSARRAFLAASPEIAQLQSLRSASAQLRDVWEDILSGGGSPESAQRVFEDLSRALDALNAVRKANTSPQ